MKRRTFLESVTFAGAMSIAGLARADETNEDNASPSGPANDWGIRFAECPALENALRIAAGIYPKNRRRDDLSRYYPTGYRMTASPHGFPVAVCISPDFTFGMMGSRFVRDKLYLETFQGVLDSMPRNMRRNGKFFLNEDSLIGYDRVMSQVMYPIWIWELYLATGDVKIVRRHREPLLRCLKYIESRTDSHGVVNQVDRDDWQYSEGGDWVDWSPERMEGSTCVYHTWYARALNYCAGIFQAADDQPSADMARRRAARQQTLLNTHFWNGKSYYDNLNFAGQKVDHFWLDSQLWPIAWSFASPEQASAIFARIDAQPDYYEGTPMRWCPSIPESEARQLERDYEYPGGTTHEPHLRPFSWFGRLGSGGILARRAAGQDAHAYKLLDRYAQLVVKYGTCVECLDMNGNVQPGTSGGRDYLEHAGGLLLAAGRGLWGIDDTGDGSLVWKPWRPQGAINVSIPYWRRGRCWTFGYEHDHYWIDPAGGQGTVKLVLDGKQQILSLSGKRMVIQ